MIFQVPIKEVGGVSYQEFEHEQSFVEIVKPKIIIPEPIYNGFSPLEGKNLYEEREEALDYLSECLGENQIIRTQKRNDVRIQLCRRLTVGLDYSKYFDSETLEFGVREGLSNIIIKNNVKITIEKGLLLVFVNRPENND